MGEPRYERTAIRLSRRQLTIIPLFISLVGAVTAFAFYMTSRGSYAVAGLFTAGTVVFALVTVASVFALRARVTLLYADGGMQLRIDDGARSRVLRAPFDFDHGVMIGVIASRGGGRSHPILWIELWDEEGDSVVLREELGVQHRAPASWPVRETVSEPANTYVNLIGTRLHLTGLLSDLAARRAEPRDEEE